MTYREITWHSSLEGAGGPVSILSNRIPSVGAPTGCEADVDISTLDGALRICLLITRKILRGIHAVWSRSPQAYDSIMLWVAATLCFFSFWAGELIVPSEATYDPAGHLSWGDVPLNDIRNPVLLRVHLKKSKCDQVGKGVDVYVGRIPGDILCPVAADLAFLAARFVKGVPQALAVLGLPCNQFAGHSFRIGAATMAAQAGIEDSMICYLGRWNSTAFLTYIQIPRERLAPVSRQLVSHH